MIESNFPVLILAFNRLESLIKTLNSIELQGSRDIYVSVDGPRIDFPHEVDEVKEYLKIAKSANRILDFQFLERNLGTLDGIRNGISWFFSQVHAGYIIEDDVRLHPGAFVEGDFAIRFLLEHQNIGSVNLRTIVPFRKIQNPEPCFRFSKFSTSHGWATSSNQWFAALSLDWPINFQMLKLFVQYYGFLSGFLWFERYSAEIRNLTLSKSNGNWDIYWTLAHARLNWNSIFLNRNRVSYEGYGPQATHTQIEPKHKDFVLTQGELISLSSISCFEVDRKADRYLLKHGYNLTLIKFIRRKLSLRSGIKRIFGINSRRI